MNYIVQHSYSAHGCLLASLRHQAFTWQTQMLQLSRASTFLHVVGVRHSISPVLSVPGRPLPELSVWDELSRPLRPEFDPSLP